MLRWRESKLHGNFPCVASGERSSFDLKRLVFHFSGREEVRLAVVTENQETKVLFNKELETIRTFHAGPLKRCSQCGGLVFHPCLACELTRKGYVSDPIDTKYADGDELRIGLHDKERLRYEQVRLQKVMAETVQVQF